VAILKAALRRAFVGLDDARRSSARSKVDAERASFSTTEASRARAR